ncbi:MAG TPA: serine/threonine-protein kinase [Thermoguttaceae bacterium]|nr:serine/threonine-protein kinase [Thermoguttaceae bacterium]
MSKAALKKIGPYRLVKLVHDGEASQVWKAYDDGSQQYVGIKTLTEKYKRSRERIGLLKREYAVGSKLVHPCILRIHQFGTDRGMPYLVMEWFPAPNMKLRIHQGIDKIAQVLPKVILQATEALAYFNEQGWIHRDIKPENFLIADSGEVKLLDFALARRKRGPLGRLFGQRSRVQGTQSYMSPEQIRNWALDERADLYSLACTLFHLVGGNPPFTGVSTNDLFRKHLKTPPPSLEAANPDVTPAFSSLIRAAMAKKASDRPASVRKLLNQLRQIPLFLDTPSPPAPPPSGPRSLGPDPARPV